MNDWNKNTGNKGEDIAEKWLAEKGYTILHRNWRFKHWEVDIIASLGKKLHFVEVKTRTSYRFGKPEESITKDKMSNLKNAAEEYLYQNPEWKYIQFDVMAITLKEEEVLEVFLIEDVYF
jgi:putative endonuclease